MLETTLQEMKIMHNWNDRTYRQVQIVVQLYEEVHQTYFEYLIVEAEEDEQKINKLQKRRIKQRLVSFIMYLREHNYADSSISLYVSKIKQVYLYYDIDIPRLPRLTVKKKESFEDIPTREEITKAIQHSNTKMKAVITFIASTGLRRSDVSRITIREFFEATQDDLSRQVIHDYDIPSVIEDLSRQVDIIPCFHITDVKTKISHLSFCSSESVQYIVQMLRERSMKKELHLDDSLFELQDNSITTNFQRLSDRLGFDWKTNRRKFHPHGLRKFFATTLVMNDVDLVSSEFLLGHSLSNVKSSYYFANPGKLRLKYERVVDNLCFLTVVSRVDIVSSEKRELDRLREENRDVRERLYEVEELLDMLRASVNRK